MDPLKEILAPQLADQHVWHMQGTADTTDLLVPHGKQEQINQCLDQEAIVTKVMKVYQFGEMPTLA